MTAQPWVPDAGQIIFINFTPQAGKEMAGMHPLLVLSTKAFNERTQTLVGLAMTSSDHTNAAPGGYFNPFQIENKTAKGESSFINTNQVSTFDWKARNAKPHPCGQVNAIVFNKAGNTPVKKRHVKVEFRL